MSRQRVSHLKTPPRPAAPEDLGGRGPQGAWVRLVSSDRAWALGVTAASAAVFAATFSSNVGFEDSAESIAGVQSLGILHAPGYPTYVLSAKLFSLLVPVGSLALRVNLFSLVCAALAVGGVFLVARRLGAARPAAAFGAGVLATGTSMWFYAGFAKSYTVTALLLVALVLLVLDWRASGGTGRLIAAGAIAGLAGGASYQVVALALPGLAAVLLRGPRRPSRRELAALIGAGAVTLAAVLGFVLVRAGQHPAINWGEATSLGRLVDLERMKDFGFITKGFAGGDEAGFVTTAAGRLGRYPGLLAHEFLWPAIVVASVGFVESWRRRRNRAPAILLTLMFALNVGGVVVLVGIGRSRGFEEVLRSGGFYLAANLSVALWAAIGADAALRWARAVPSARRGRRARRPGPAPAARAAATVALLAVLGGQAAAHASPASHRHPPLAADYASNLLDHLPPDAALLVWGANHVFPLRYRQIVLGRRGDVDVVAITLLKRAWYREQLTRELGRPLPAGLGQDNHGNGALLARELLRARPVYLDYAASLVMRRTLGLRVEGMVARVTADPEPEPAPPEERARLFARLYRTRGLYSDPARLLFPNRIYLLNYAAAHAELGLDFARREDFENAVAQVRLALRIDPENRRLRSLLADLERRSVTGGR